MSGLLERELELERRKAAGKLGDVFLIRETVVPDGVVVEQASSFITAGYAASLVKKGSVMADLTAGLGVNTFGFSQVASKVYAVELDLGRADALRHNIEVVGVDNVEVICGDGVRWLRECPGHLDTVFVDPSRRDASGRTFLLEDCSPNVLELVDCLHNVGCLIVKVSPLLDISAAVRLMPQIARIHIVEVAREVKELLLEIDPRRDGTDRESVSVDCVRLNGVSPPEIISFQYPDMDTNSRIPYLSGKVDIETGGFVYEPSPAIMKAGMFGGLASRFPGIKKFGSNTHLFFSNEYFPGFPGRVFKVEDLMGSTDLKKVRGKAFNVISRNHPAKAPEIENRYRLRPSPVGNFIVACTVGKQKAVIRASLVADRTADETA